MILKREIFKKKVSTKDVHNIETKIENCDFIRQHKKAENKNSLRMCLIYNLSQYVPVSDMEKQQL